MTPALERWRHLVAMVNDQSCAGVPGVRDTEAPCDAYDPVGGPDTDATGDGHCETDGHYLCRECRNISLEALRRRRDECQECGAMLVPYPGGGQEPVWCPKCDRDAAIRRGGV